MIGAGLHIRVQMWNDDAEGDDQIIADGILYPGSDFHCTFKDGAQAVTRWALTRLTADEVDQLDAEQPAAGRQEFYE